MTAALARAVNRKTFMCPACAHVGPSRTLKGRDGRFMYPHKDEFGRDCGSARRAETVAVDARNEVIAWGEVAVREMGL